MFENVKARKNPIGLEFIKQGILTDIQVTRVLEYQKDHRDLKFGEIVDILDMCEKTQLLDVLSNKLQYEGVMLDGKLDVIPVDYLPRDIIINYRALPFKLEGNNLSVAFADVQNVQKTKEIELMLMNAGYEMQMYVTLYTSIMKQIGDVRTVENKFVDKEEKDTSKLIDNIIMTAISKRASDIHVEPLGDKIRIRFRIDGELITATELPKDRQAIVTGRIKSIANMHQEITYDQDGSINTYENFSIRVSSQKNVNGEKFVLRFLKKNANLRTLEDLGFPQDKELISVAFEKRNSMILICAPTGEGKTTTLYSVLDFLDKPEINIISIENPVEMRMNGINQVEIGPNITFASALRTVLRQDPDIILVGEIRDQETAAIAIEAGQTGHLVLATIHTIDAIEAVTRIKKMGISSYDVSATLVTTISQRLIRKLCGKCKKPHILTDDERKYIARIEKNTGEKFVIDETMLFESVGCQYCNGIGYYDRVGAFEILCINEELKDMISEGASTIDIRKYAKENTSYKPLIVDGIKKVLLGITTIDELKRKIIV
ncbi:MAG: GspE/PulE family protein [Clostridia bacterium]|nr:GspE/PulE family protein [Clostridia bacterium]MDD4386271.1 GspE/PulE family protein [Clostridia bacterium]